MRHPASMIYQTQVLFALNLFLNFPIALRELHSKRDIMPNWFLFTSVRSNNMENVLAVWNIKKYVKVKLPASDENMEAIVLRNRRLEYL